jgi:hypothetical protein
MTRAFLSVVSLLFTLLIPLAVFSINVQFEDFYRATGIKLKDAAKTVEVGKTVDAIVTSPDKLTKLGFPDAKEDMELRLTFKSEKMVEIVFLSLQKKAYFAYIQGEWELQSFISAKKISHP